MKTKIDIEIDKLESDIDELFNRLDSSTLEGSVQQRAAIVLEVLREGLDKANHELETILTYEALDSNLDHLKKQVGNVYQNDTGEWTWEAGVLDSDPPTYYCFSGALIDYIKALESRLKELEAELPYEKN